MKVMKFVSSQQYQVLEHQVQQRLDQAYYASFVEAFAYPFLKLIKETIKDKIQL
jgi:outer membrane lipopolysaccharide assembly protein LptE/RlpB